MTTPIRGADGLTDDEFNKLWMMGLSGERTLGRPKDWDGSDKMFDEFVYKFSTWIGGLPGDVEQMLEIAQQSRNEMPMGSLTTRQQTISRSISAALRSMTGGKALNIVKGVERGNGFECWRRLWAEYRPAIAARRMNLLEGVMSSKPGLNEDFSSWYYSWLEMIREAEQVRKKVIDDDVKCAVALRRSPEELRDHLVLETGTIADQWDVMNAKILAWMTARRPFIAPTST